MTMRLPFPVRTGRVFGIIGLIVTSLFLLSSQAAHAQLWQLDARLVTPIDNGPVRAFLDTLVQTTERTEEIHVRRSPDQKERLHILTLEERLMEEHQIGVTGANRLLIEYRFEMSSDSHLGRQIISLSFLFRSGLNRPDIPILHLDAQKEWVQDIMLRKGTAPSPSESAVLPFRRHLRFGHMTQQDETRIVEVGGETIREEFAEEKQSLIQKLMWLTIEV